MPRLEDCVPQSPGHQALLGRLQACVVAGAGLKIPVASCQFDSYQHEHEADASRTTKFGVLVAPKGGGTCVVVPLGIYRHGATGVMADQPLGGVPGCDVDADMHHLLEDLALGKGRSGFRITQCVALERRFAAAAQAPRGRQSVRSRAAEALLQEGTQLRNGNLQAMA